MLKKFTVKNFKNFKDNYTLDLNAKNYSFNQECVNNNIINDAIIYGPNAIGKSNLGLALFDITSHLTDKQRNIDKYTNYLNLESETDIAEFSYTFSFEEGVIEYKYGKKNIDNIEYEELKFNDETILSYDRKKNKTVEISLEGAESLKTNLDAIKISVVKYINTNAVLTDNHNSRLFDKFLNFINNMLLFKNLDERFYQGFEVGSSNIVEYIISNNKLEDFQRFLNESGIQCRLSSTQEGEQSKLNFIFNNGDIDFNSNSSTGTRALTLFYYWILKAENKSLSFLFIDEFDAFYHYSLSESIVRFLKSKNFQTMLTTHNISLMSNDLLRPDCYYLMYKDKMKTMNKLTDKEIRLAHNLEKMYKAGAFCE